MSAPTLERTARRRPSGSTLLVAGGLVAAVVTAIVLAGQDSGRTAALDPDNPGPNGAQALARVLDDQGVDLTVVRSADALDAAGVDGDTTVLVTSADLLGRSTTDRLLDDAAPGRLVVVEPGPGTTDALGVTELPSSLALEDPVESGCADPTYAGLTIDVDRALAYAVDDGCFPTDDGALLVEPRPGTVLLGAGDALRNDQVLHADNAAVGLRLLGRSDRLVWYVPSLDDLVGDDGVSVSTLLPPWLRPALWLVAVATLGLLVWRARRLGPLAIEPLPVAVKAIETTRSRGRLYRKAGDRAHAATVLRAAARGRATELLRLGAHPDPEALVRDVARHTGRPVAEVDALLGPHAPAPTTDHDLITLADQLAELEKEVRRP
ncbi:hypothetical protein ASC77_08310 [Nocardioides sp. Root1257]|uniref:DUF4350 domain-containing protein n=1 Tax=unclassified Nocardioides TaxID=2615069 RepID=UPI0006FBF189|nr:MULTISPECIES: DUF4350 domain-containing protein [unclassified Nocardioides]KQW48729.1 hypothetical protein ASC77_08310 [Nocardioides sp. Root1257]KRC47904.1 hypothetical protein ASE24_08315 [Nocardioides sp. Root224]